ncbi:TetR/AcrR family transcriptional regulator [Nocardioides sp. Bht2]|uniref:TetR/AcrR family transcriptional regulator n=1 Tax=Nocardioides sp. Bht2 TaxID=3392297 RepID=UPI0039B45012
MTDRPLLPLADAAPRERSDAARNRDAVLAAALRLVDEHGVAAVTMESVAEAAGVGKGTVFRRFENRSGLFAAVLDHSEARWQESVMTGEPPLGPGALALDRLLAFGDSRISRTLSHAELFGAASTGHTRSYPVWSFTSLHVQHLLRELDVTGDIPLLAAALLAPMEMPILSQQVRIEKLPLPRIVAAWQDLARRVVGA